MSTLKNYTTLIDNTNNRTYPIKKHHIFMSNLGFFEFYKNGNLKVGAAGPYSIWEKQ
jgi:hypothetical protein